MCAPADAVGILARQRHGLCEMRCKQRKITARAGLDPCRLGHGTQRRALLRQLRRHPAMVLKRLANLRDHGSMHIGAAAVERQCGLCAVERALGVRMQQHIESDPGEGGDLQAAALRSASRHHGARIPDQHRRRIQHVVDGGNTLAQRGKGRVVGCGDHVDADYRGSGAPVVPGARRCANAAMWNAACCGR